LDEVAWYNRNSGGETHPVAQKKPNEFGLYDMSGNVWEWCADWYGEDYYQTSPDVDPQGPASGLNRVLRGGSWRDLAGNCRLSDRNRDYPERRSSVFGLRLSL
jgi:formylglycine-generating enzyme required for sulfatase activity